jgi:hypothetical protein
VVLHQEVPFAETAIACLLLVAIVAHLWPVSN